MPYTIGKCKLFRIKRITLLEGETFLRNKHKIAFFKIKCTFFGRKENTIRNLLNKHLNFKLRTIKLILFFCCCCYATHLLSYTIPPPQKKISIQLKNEKIKVPLYQSSHAAVPAHSTPPPSSTLTNQPYWPLQSQLWVLYYPRSNNNK